MQQSSFFIANKIIVYDNRRRMLFRQIYAELVAVLQRRMHCTIIISVPFVYCCSVCQFISDLFCNLHHNPFFVCSVAPVTCSTESGDPFSSTVNFCSSIASATVDSIRANWSPTHFLGPPPKGKKAKSAII